MVALLFGVAMLSAGAHGMPMTVGDAGAAMHQDCRACLPVPSPGTTSGGKTLPCPTLACPGAAAMLVTPVWLPLRTVLWTGFASAAEIEWAAAPRAPDPFPPRPIALL